LWTSLILEKDFYSFTSPSFSGIINKEISDEKLFNCLDNIKKVANTYYSRIHGYNFSNITFDDELKQKITQIGWK